MKRRDLILGAGALGLACPHQDKSCQPRNIQMENGYHLATQLPGTRNWGYENGKKHRKSFFRKTQNKSFRRR